MVFDPKRGAGIFASILNPQPSPIIKQIEEVLDKYNHPGMSFSEAASLYFTISQMMSKVDSFANSYVFRGRTYPTKDQLREAIESELSKYSK